MKQGRDDAVQVFRQFAWNLAGKLAQPKPARPAGRPLAQQSVKR
jgi:hypothetical protein